MIQFLKALPTIVQILAELLRWAAANKKIAQIKDIHNTIEQIKGAKTDEEKAILSKKLADFWANPK